MKAIQLLVNSVLPDDLKNYEADLTDKGLNKILYAVAEKHPEKFAQVLKDISDIGRKVSYQQGETLTLYDLAPVIDRQAIYDNMEREIAALPRDKNFIAKRREIFQKYNEFIEKETSKNALARKNNIAISVLSGARGKSAQLKAMVSTPGTFSDYKGTPVDIFSKESFADGIRPIVFLASTNGARSSVISTKSSTAKGGDLAKQMAQSVVDMVIRKQDCGVNNGIALNIDDESLKGRVLAKDVAGFKAGEFITRSMLHALRNKGIDTVIARSALTCGCADGLCAKCVGKFYKGGKLPKIGDSIGAAVSTSASEPVTQMALCLSEHTFVRMADGSTKYIKDIVPGEYVLGADVKANTFPVKVVNLYDQGLQEVQDYTFGKGQTKYRATITATKNHKVLLNKRTSSKSNKDKYGCSWGTNPYKLSVIRLADINKNTHAVYSRSVEGFDGVSVTPILAYMAGMFIGDGIRYEKGSTPKVSCADNTLVDEVNNESAVIGMKLIKRKRGHDWAFTRNTTVGNNPFSALLCELGLDSKYCYEKELPEVIWRWDNGTLANLIAGYFDADGSIYKLSSGNYGINFTSTSKALIEQLKSILEFRFAIHSTPVYTESALRKGSNHLRSSININRVDLVKRFADIIGKYSKGKKRIKLTELDFTGLQDRNPSGYTFGKFISASTSRLEHCFDIEVDHPDHLFVLANGLIVSNSAKHTAGMTTSKRTYSGLGTISQFTQSPEKFKDQATVSELDGTVEDIQEAAQGGYYVTIGKKKHYVPAGHPVEVKVGQTVEAGDFLSEGLGDAEDVVKYKGLGVGRLYYANRLHQILADSGAKSDKRSIEVLARGALRHVRITDDDGLGAYLPDDIIDYNHLQAYYKMPETSRIMNAKDAIGKYLQAPVLHYSIGTKITPKVAKDLQDKDMADVYVDDKEPKFKPEMIRLRAASHTNPDWMASMGTSYLTKQLNESAVKGDDTNVESNSDYRPRLAYGKDFGKDVENTGLF